MGTPANGRKGYLRDGRAPVPVSETTSRIVSRNRGKDTSVEVKLRKALWHSGLRGYRKNMKGLPGRPDIVFTRQKLAIFVNGCFWHRCPMCKPSTPKSNTEFWNEKFERNKARDLKNLEDLGLLGWRAITIWECEIRSDLDGVVGRIESQLDDEKR